MKNSIPAYQQQAFVRAAAEGKVTRIVTGQTLSGRAVPARQIEQRRSGRPPR